MRCYFHLVNGEDAILDDTGVEVADLETARTEALRAIQELRQELDGFTDEWMGWQLDVVCPQGTVLLSVELKTTVH
jgi:predicted alpha-1,6-mannanase (GH76 family)